MKGDLLKGLFDPEEATRQLEKAIVPAADSYEYPTGPFTRHEATLRIQEIRDAIAAYARTDDTLEADAALLAIMRAVGTQKSPRALYGGPGGFDGPDQSWQSEGPGSLTGVRQASPVRTEGTQEAEDPVGLTPCALRG